MSEIRNAIREAIQFSIHELKRQRRHRVMQPTDTQVSLMGRLRKLGKAGISFEEALALDWRVLGGLFTRRRVEWFPSQEGVRLRVRSRGPGRPRKDEA